MPRYYIQMLVTDAQRVSVNLYLQVLFDDPEGAQNVAVPCRLSGADPFVATHYIGVGNVSNSHRQNILSYMNGLEGCAAYSPDEWVSPANPAINFWAAALSNWDIVPVEG